MGDAQSIPVIGEVVTCVESGAKIVAAGACAIVGETDAAGKLARGAGNSWKEYSEKSLIVAPINSLISVIDGDEKEADRIMKKSLGALENVVDSTPVVGHVVGVGHYIAGNTEHGNKCMFNASRSTAVLGTGMLTGGLGGGAVLGGLTGLEAGMIYDVSASVVKDEPSGCVQGIKDAVESDDPNKAIDFGLGLAGDFCSGYAGAELGEAVRVKVQQQTIENSYQNLKDTGKMPSEFDPKKATGDTIDAAKNMKENIKSGKVKGDGHVSTRVRNMETNDVSQGYNARARADINQAKFEAQGTDSGFTSKTNARKTGLRGTSELQRTQPDVQPVLDRKVTSCAEHDAFNSHYKQPGASTSNAQTVSVEYRDGSYSTVKRCPNCYEYDMGKVPTDAASGKTVPTTDPSSYVESGAKDAFLKKTQKEDKKKKHE